MLFLSSCTTEKRVYRLGYHTEWNKSKWKDGKEMVNERNQIVTFQQMKNEINEVSDLFVVPNDDLTASLNSCIVISQRKTNEINEKDSLDINKIEPASIDVNTTEIKNESRELKINNDIRSNDDGGSLALRILGWFIWTIGILTIIFVSILGGLIIAALGCLFILLGKKKKGGVNNDNKSEMQDVVYLKNGSIIKGMIIEQIPGVSIKIQTKDGSVFVYNIDEISKMTKESSK